MRTSETIRSAGACRNKSSASRPLLAARTAASASSRVFTCGTCTPHAPRSRNGAIISGLFPTGRTIGDMPLSLQSKLLRAIEERITRRVGGIRDRRMCQQHCLEFRRRYLESFIFDQLLRTIDDEEMSIFIRVTDVAGV